MGKICKPSAVKLVAGFIYKEREFFDRAKVRLEKKFGSADLVSEELDFNFTDYYKKEFSEPLKRRFISFKRLINPHALFKIKLYTNRLESRFLKDGRRRINIDPGYLDLAKLVLASTKDFAHRIYLRKGIFAEVTLIFKDGAFQPWDWTYPDYRSKEYLDIFNQIRSIHAKS